MTQFTFSTTMEIGDDFEEIELEVTYDVTPFIPARLYGDYPQPAEGGEVELISVKHKGNEFILTATQEQTLLDTCNMRVHEDFADEAAAAADYRYEQYRDRLYDSQ